MSLSRRKPISAAATASSALGRHASPQTGAPPKPGRMEFPKFEGLTREVADKFLDCAAFARWPREKASQVVETVSRLETVSDIRTLTALLAMPSKGEESIG